MQPDNPSTSNWPSLPPVRHTEISRWIGWLNFPFSLFYLVYFSWPLLTGNIKNFKGSGVPIHVEVTAYFVCFVSLFLGGILLLKEKALGKKLVQLAGIMGLLTLCVFGVWSLTFLWIPPYDEYPEGVFENFIDLVERFAVLFAYPMIASIILTRKSDKDLGLD